MIDRTHVLPICRQAKVLNISRATVYYQPRPVSPKDLRVMRRIDELHLERPFAGARMLRDFLHREGLAVGRRHVATLMKRMGIEARSIADGIHRNQHPVMLQDLPVSSTGRDGRWAELSLGDGHHLGYPDGARGFVYLVAVVDWFTRRVLSHRGVDHCMMEAGFASRLSRRPSANMASLEIFNSDQGSQFTSEAFTSILEKNGIAISMDGKGSWRDNVFVERLWRSVKYEEVSPATPTIVAEARASLSRYSSTFSIVNAPIRALTARRQTRPTSQGDSPRGSRMKFPQPSNPVE